MSYQIEVEKREDELLTLVAGNAQDAYRMVSDLLREGAVIPTVWEDENTPFYVAEQAWAFNHCKTSGEACLIDYGCGYYMTGKEINAELEEYGEEANFQESLVYWAEDTGATYVYGKGYAEFDDVLKEFFGING